MEFQLSISPSNEQSGLISFRIDWFDFLADQGTLKRFLQHHYSKASILWCSAFFMAQLSHPYITTGKTIWTSVGKLMSLLLIYCLYHGGFSGGSDGKVAACIVEDLGSIPGPGRSSGEGNGNPPQYSCLENSMDGGDWWATVHGVEKSRT